MTIDGRPILLGLPKDQETLAAIGIISIRHGQLDNSLCWTVGKLANLTREEMLDATARKGSQELREIIRKLARQRFGVSDTSLKLDAILNRAKRVTEKRNDLLHSLWGYALDHGAVKRRDDHQFEDAPPVADLNAVAEEITAVMKDLNAARLEGFLHVALNQKKKEPAKSGVS